MSDFDVSIGTRTRDYGSFAEKNFAQNLSRWIGYPTEAISTPDPDLDKVDFKIKLPSLLDDSLDMVPRHISFEWQVKHTKNRPPLKKIKLGTTETLAFKTKIDKKTVKGLRERAGESGNSLFLAYGILKPLPNGVPIVDSDAYDVFEWYGLDLRQYFRMFGEECETIYIPIENRLNLLSFTLLWSSHWVKEFYSPLRKGALVEHKDLSDFIAKVYTQQRSTTSADDIVELQNELENKLPRLVQDLPVSDAEKRRLSTALGLGVALEDIGTKIRGAGSMEQLSTYCPESLYGTAGLWLFSRSYWSFMSASSVCVDPQYRIKNQRWLPVRLDLNNTPRLLWALLHCVVQVYEKLGVNVAVIRPFSANEIGADISVYGGNIGHLPYISLSEDGLGWTRETISKGDLEGHKDFFAEAKMDVVLDRNHKLSQIPSFKNVPESQLKLPEKIPKLFLAPENNLIKHPIKLWKGNLV